MIIDGKYKNNKNIKSIITPLIFYFKVNFIFPFPLDEVIVAIAPFIIVILGETCPISAFIIIGIFKSFKDS